MSVISIEGFAEQVRAAIEEKLGPVERQILEGNCKTFDEYRQKCGERRGLMQAAAALDAAHDLLNRPDSSQGLQQQEKP